METFFPRLFKNQDIQKVMIVLGFISTLLPWYVYALNDLTTSLSIISGLSAANSIGLEIAGVLFYLGLAMCAFRKIAWIGAGVLCLIASLMAGWLSATSVEGFFQPSVSAGLGLFLGAAVIIFFMIVWLVRAREVYDDTNALVPK